MADATTLAPVPAVKPGIKTSEFWVTILTVIGSTATSLAGILPPKIAGILVALSTVAYTISRGLAK